jgi:alkylhydroperoxidase family enzyme
MVRPARPFALVRAIVRVPRYTSTSLWDQASGEFSPEELAPLLFAIVAINGYNRLAIATRMEVGGYQPAPVSG